MKHAVVVDDTVFVLKPRRPLPGRPLRLINFPARFVVPFRAVIFD